MDVGAMRQEDRHMNAAGHRVAFAVASLAMSLAACGAPDGAGTGRLPPGAYCAQASAGLSVGLAMASSAEARAAVAGDLATLRRWQASGAPDPVAESGMTLLHWAALAGRAEAAGFLLSAGADPNARDDIGDTPLHSAEVGCHVAVIRLLMAPGADPGLRNELGDRAYDIASRAGATELLPLLRR